MPSGSNASPSWPRRCVVHSGRPACINVLIDPDEMHPSMPAMVGADNPAENEIMIPYYDNIRL